MFDVDLHLLPLLLKASRPQAAHILHYFPLPCQGTRRTKRAHARRFSAFPCGSVEGGVHVLQCLDFAGGKAGRRRDLLNGKIHGLKGDQTPIGGVGVVE